MTTVAIIGAGGIGSRHLQGLARLTGPAQIKVVDPNEAALDLARERWEQVAVSEAHEACFHASAAHLPDRIDVAIVATTAGVRLQVLLDLLGRASVGAVVLEKFLFQSAGDYNAARSALTTAGTSAFVNTPRRMWPGYEWARDAFSGDPTVSCRVTTIERHAIATTAIHFLDALAFVAGQNAYDLRHDRLSLTPAASRRDGYIEYGGLLYGFSPDGGVFEYLTHSEGDAPLVVDLSSPRRRLYVRETESRAWYCESASGWVWEERKFAGALQSELTHRIVDAVVSTGTCGLPDFDESAALHTTILETLLDGHERLTGERLTATPIT